MDCITSTLVSVRFPGILPEPLDEEILSPMGDKVGRTVRVDPMFLMGLKSKYARVCVEVNFAAPLIPSLTVFEMAQRVEYEGLHLICFQCGKYGHKGDECPFLYPQTSEDTAPTQAPCTSKKLPKSSNPSSDCPYGPWMLPDYQHMRRVQQLQ